MPSVEVHWELLLDPILYSIYIYLCIYIYMYIFLIHKCIYTWVRDQSFRARPSATPVRAVGSPGFRAQGLPGP